MKQLLLSLAVLPFFMSCGESAPIKARVAATPKTFCNPVNIDYRFMKIDGGEGIREAADPVVVSYKDKYYCLLPNHPDTGVRTILQIGSMCL